MVSDEDMVRILKLFGIYLFMHAQLKAHLDAKNLVAPILKI